MKLTNKQVQILKTFKAGEPMTPTEIGEANGKSYNEASSWACGGIKALVERGLVRQLYSRGLYLITEPGIKARDEHA